MEEDRNAQTHAFLKAKIQIGSSKGPVSFQRTQTVFHHDDVPERSRSRKSEVMNWARSRVLDTNRPTWNKSTDPNVPVVVRKNMENHIHDRSKAFQYNYRAESLDPLKMAEPIDVSTKFHISAQLPAQTLALTQLRQKDPIQAGRHHRTQELPNHPILELATPWNNTTVLTIKEQQDGLNRMTTHSKDWSTKVSSTLPQKKEYIGPMKSVKLFQEKIRKMKEEGTFSSEVVFNRPNSEPVDRKNLRNRNMVGKMNVITTTEHSGTWGPNALDGRPMWSDTGSFEFDSKGDMLKKTNLDQQNYANPVKSSRRMLPSSSKSSRPQTRPGSAALEGESISTGTLTRFG